MTIDFAVDPKRTKMFKSFGDQAVLFSTHPILYNHHVHGIDPRNFETDQGLKSMFYITSLGIETLHNPKTYVASMESD
jgi:hypothetical protein